jgi:hypothetical protein
MDGVVSWFLIDGVSGYWSSACVDVRGEYGGVLGKFRSRNIRD